MAGIFRLAIHGSVGKRRTSCAPPFGSGENKGVHAARKSDSTAFAFDRDLPGPGGRPAWCRPFSDETWMSRQKIRNALSACLIPAVSGKALFFGSFLWLAPSMALALRAGFAVRARSCAPRGPAKEM